MRAVIRADPLVLARADAAVMHEEARARSALPYDNPFVGGQREQSFGASLTGTAEDYVWVGQTFDPSFRRGLLSDAGKLRGEAARLEHEAFSRARVVDALTLFAEILAREQIARAHAAWMNELDASMARLRQREEAGDAARYDVLRLERERTLAAQLLDDAAIDAARARALFARIVDEGDPDFVVEGHLAPPSPPSLQASTVTPPLSRAHATLAQALEREESAAARWFLPPVTVTAGGKTVFAPSSTELGYIVTAQVPIPLFEREQGARAARRAEAAMAHADADLAARAATREASAAHAEWSAAKAALARQEQRTDGAALVETARAAFVGGEISIDALLDAERAARDDALYRIALARRARVASIHFRILTEEVSP